MTKCGRARGGIGAGYLEIDVDIRITAELPCRFLEERHAAVDDLELEIGEGGQRAIDVIDAVMLHRHRSEEHTSELQSLMRISYAVFCLKKKKQQHKKTAE